MTKTTIKQTLTRGVSEVLPNKDGLAQLMAKRKIRLYLGIDPTGSFLHLGHAVALRKIQQFADLGHQVILLVGNGTVKIGDPTGRDASRPMLTDEVIEANFQDWKKQASKILNFDKIEIRHNGDWLDNMALADFIKIMAKTTLQQLIERDMFQERIKKGLPIHGHEILYPMLQGYDSVAMDVDLEVGGNDQTFNMMMGRTLQKIYHNKEKWVLTVPIINGTDGRKMSKSFNNYVALTDKPNDMYGKLMSIKDELIMQYFTLITDVADENIETMKKAMQAGENPMKFKKQLALTITSDLHDPATAKKAAQHFEKTVQGDELEVTGKSDTIGEKQSNAIDMLKKCSSKRSRSNIRRTAEQGGVIVILKNGTKKNIKNDPYEIFETTKVDKIKLGKRECFLIQT